MSKVKKNIHGVLKGGFLVNERAFKSWRVIIFVVLLLLFMISSSHRADRKVMEIARINKELRELRAEYIDTGTILMRMKMESAVRNKVKEKGLFPSVDPPQKIKVTTKRK